MKTIYFLFFVFSISYAHCQTNTIGAIKNTPEALDGYTLFAPLLGYHTYLINNCGEEINKWTHAAESRFSVELTEDGYLLRSAEASGASPLGTTGGKAGRLEKVDWNNNVVWSYDYISAVQSDSGQYISHHDFELLPNGNILLLVWENQPASVLAEHGMHSSFNHDYMWMEKIIEIEPVGLNGANIVWEWNIFDHLIQDNDPSRHNYGVVENNPHRFDINKKRSSGYVKDLFHANSIDYNAELDQILITIKHQGEIWIIDHSTTTEEAKTSSGGLRGKGGDLLYRWGNPATYKVSTGGQKLHNPHHAEWIPEGYKDAGKITIYNNGNHFFSIPSKAAIIDPHMNADGSYPVPNPGETFLPNSFHWEYQMNLDIVQPGHISDQLSGLYRLDNGNTLICNGLFAGYFIELDSNDNIVWEYYSPIGAREHLDTILTQGESYATGLFERTDVYRAVKYKPNFIGFLGKDLTPGDPLELDPYPNACTLYPDSTLEPLSIEVAALNVSINNPITSKLNIINTNEEELIIQIYNVSGQSIYSTRESNGLISIDAETWNQGLYFIQVTTQDSRRFEHKIIKL